MSELEQAAAWKALVESAVAPWKVYEYSDKVIADPTIPLPDSYVLLASVDARFAEPNRLVGSRGTTSYRVTLRPVSKTVGSVRWLRDRISNAVRYSSLVVGTDHSTPIQLEASESIAPDEGRYSALSSWTYTI